MRPELLLFLLISLTVMYVFHQLVIVVVERCCKGTPAPMWTRRFWREGGCSRVFAFLALTLAFTYFGGVITLLPYPSIKESFRAHDNHQVRTRPYDGGELPVRDDDSEAINRLRRNTLIAAFGIMIMIAGMRILVITYQERLSAGMVYLVLTMLGFGLFSCLYDFTTKMGLYHTLTDMIRHHLPSLLPFVVVAASATCALAEYVLSRFPPVTEDAAAVR